MTRDEAIAAIAVAFGWTVYHDGDGKTRLGGRNAPGEVPAADAPLPVALAFVGRVAEALHAFPTVTCGNVGKKTADGYRIQYEATVAFDLPHVPPPGVQFGQASAEDLSFAALLAGTAAKESKHV